MNLAVSSFSIIQTRRDVVVVDKAFTSDIIWVDQSCFVFISSNQSTNLTEYQQENFNSLLWHQIQFCIIMTDNQPEQSELRGSGYLLPPVKLYSRNRASNQMINNILQIAQNKRRELQGKIRRSEQTDNSIRLNYLRSQPSDQPQPVYRSFDNPAIQEEMVARGSIGQWMEEAPVSRLIQTNMYPKQDTPSASRFFVSDREDQRFILRKNKRYTTEPKHHQFPNKKLKGKTVKTDQTKKKERMSYLANQTEETGRKKYAFEEQRSIVGEFDTEMEQIDPDPVYKESQYHLMQKQSAKTPAFQSKFESKMKTRNQSIKSVQEVKHPQTSLKMVKFYEAIYTLKKSAKTNQRLQKVIVALEQFNSFFRKTQRVLAVCLLRIGNVVNKYPQHLLYQASTSYNHFYIILSGKIKLLNRDGMHKMCEAGQTLLQEVIFGSSNWGQDPVSLESARVIEQSWLLRIDLLQLGKLQRQLVKYGFKRGLVQLKNMIKRNQIVKNWIRSKAKLLRNQ